MKKILGIVVLGLLWCNFSLARDLQEIWSVGNWQIEETETRIKVSTEGTIQKGDKLTFWVKKNSLCNQMEHTFTFYTTNESPSIKEIEGKDIAIKSLGGKTIVKLQYIVSAEPNMKGNFAFISAGTYDIEEHTKFLEKHKNLDVELEFIFVDSERTKGLDASDYFDILSNSWSLKDVRAAIEDAVSLCEYRIKYPLNTKKTSSENSNSLSSKKIKLYCKGKQKYAHDRTLVLDPMNKKITFKGQTFSSDIWNDDRITFWGPNDWRWDIDRVTGSLEDQTKSFYYLCKKTDNQNAF